MKFKEIFTKNPIFILMIGLCPTLAISTTFEAAYLIGISVLLVLIFSNLLISLVAKYIPQNIKIPSYIMIIATIVTILDLLLNHFVPDAANVLGIYIPLIVVNCIILARALEVASKGNVKESLKDALISGLGFLIAVAILGLIREVLGSGSITILNLLTPLTGYRAVYDIVDIKNFLPVSFFISPAGAFITLAFILAFLNKIRKKVNK